MLLEKEMVVQSSWGSGVQSSGAELGSGDGVELKCGAIPVQVKATLVG